MPTDLSLAEAGKLVSPWRFDRWVTLRRIAEKKSPLPPKRQQLVDQAADQIFGRHRARWLERHDVDARSLTPSYPGESKIGHELYSASFVERERMVSRYAMAEARAEAEGPLISLYYKACKRIAGAVGRKIVEAIKRDGARVTATNRNGDRRELSRAELREGTFYFELAVIEIGGRPWGAIAVDLPDMPLDRLNGSPVAASDRRTPTMEETLVSWFKTLDGQRYRDKSNAHLRVAFKRVYPQYKDHEVTKTSIAKARAALGWEPRRSTASVAIGKSGIGK